MLYQGLYYSLASKIDKILHIRSGIQSVNWQFIKYFIFIHQ